MIHANEHSKNRMKRKLFSNLSSMWVQRSDVCKMLNCHLIHEYVLPILWPVITNGKQARCFQILIKKCIHAQKQYTSTNFRIMDYTKWADVLNLWQISTAK